MSELRLKYSERPSADSAGLPWSPANASSVIALGGARSIVPSCHATQQLASPVSPETGSKPTRPHAATATMTTQRIDPVCHGSRTGREVATAAAKSAYGRGMRGVLVALWIVATAGSAAAQGLDAERFVPAISADGGFVLDV